MAQLNPFSIYSLWVQNNSHSSANPVIMTAIALAESSGNPEEVNSIGACGLWQIHPYEEGCLNPATNAKQAGQKFASQGYGAWTTYKTGAYKVELPLVETSLREAGAAGKSTAEGVGFLGIGVGPNVAPEASETVRKAAEAAVSWTGELGEILKFLSSSSGWLRIGKVILGGVVILIAIEEISKVGTGSTSPGLPGKALKVGELVGVGAAAKGLIKPEVAETAENPEIPNPVNSRAEVAQYNAEQDAKIAQASPLAEAA
jgi:hypothetical protein